MVKEISAFNIGIGGSIQIISKELTQNVCSQDKVTNSQVEKHTEQHTNENTIEHNEENTEQDTLDDTLDKKIIAHDTFDKPDTIMASNRLKSFDECLLLSLNTKDLQY